MGKVATNVPEVDLTPRTWHIVSELSTLNIYLGYNWVAKVLDPKGLGFRH